MKALVQRTLSAQVSTNTALTGSIGRGLLVFLGVESHDACEDLDYLVHKIVNLRVFADAEDKMNLSIKAIGGSILLVSQFTLCASTRKGNRPSFSGAATPVKGQEFYLNAIEKFRSNDIIVETGEFGANMEVSLINDGPVTIFLDSKDRFLPRK